MFLTFFHSLINFFGWFRSFGSRFDTWTNLSNVLIKITVNKEWGSLERIMANVLTVFLIIISLLKEGDVQGWRCLHSIFCDRNQLITEIILIVCHRQWINYVRQNWSHRKMVRTKQSHWQMARFQCYVRRSFQLQLMIQSAAEPMSDKWATNPTYKCAFRWSATNINPIANRNATPFWMGMNV